MTAAAGAAGVSRPIGADDGFTAMLATNPALVEAMVMPEAPPVAEGSVTQMGRRDQRRCRVWRASTRTLGSCWPL